MPIEDILISVENRHAQSMLSGLKTVELRRRALKLLPGTRIWVYTKLPKGIVELVAIVDAIECDRPANLWTRHRTKVGITLREFEHYFADVALGYAIVFRQVLPVRRNIDLKKLREACSSFQPPQFFKRLSPNAPELRILLEAV